MADDDKTNLAKKGLALIDAASPAQIRKRIKESVSETATDAIRQGAETFGRWTGREDASEVSRSRDWVDVETTLDAMEDDSLACFDARLGASQSDTKVLEKQDQKARRAALQDELANVRQSFPDESKELAVLMFACVDLLDDLRQASEGKRVVSAEELAKRERLLARVAELLAPSASAALTSFVDHVVTLSRRTRGT